MKNEWVHLKPTIQIGKCWLGTLMMFSFMFQIRHNQGNISLNQPMNQNPNNPYVMPRNSNRHKQKQLDDRKKFEQQQRLKVFNKVGVKPSIDADAYMKNIIGFSPSPKRTTQPTTARNYPSDDSFGDFVQCSAQSTSTDVPQTCPDNANTAKNVNIASQAAVLSQQSTNSSDGSQGMCTLRLILYFLSILIICHFKNCNAKKFVFTRIWNWVILYCFCIKSVFEGLDSMMEKCSNLQMPKKASLFRQKVAVKEVVPTKASTQVYVESNKACNWSRLSTDLEESFNIPVKAHVEGNSCFSYHMDMS